MIIAVDKQREELAEAILEAAAAYERAVLDERQDAGSSTTERRSKAFAHWRTLVDRSKQLLEQTIREREVRARSPRLCDWCGIEMPRDKRVHAVTCSNACRIARARALKSGDVERRRCAWCDSAMSRSRRAHAVTCSKACRQARQRFTAHERAHPGAEYVHRIVLSSAARARALDGSLEDVPLMRGRFVAFVNKGVRRI